MAQLLRLWLLVVVLLCFSGGFDGRVGSVLAQVDPDNSPSQADGGGDSSYRLSSLEERMRQLVGQMEVLSHQVQELQQKLDVLSQQRGPQPGVNRFPGGAPSSSLPIAPQREGGLQPSLPQQGGGGEAPAIVEVDPTVPQEGSAKAPGPQILGTLQSNSAQNLGGQPSLVPQGVQETQIGGASPAVASPEVLYEQAYDDYRSRRFEEARGKFTSFLAQYASHAYAGRAYYWLGEVFYREGQFKDAARNFLAAYQKDPHGVKGPNALYRLGVALLKLNQKRQACGAFSEVLRKYPKATSIRSQAVSEMKKSGCG